MTRIPDYLLIQVGHQENVPPPVVTKIQELPFDKLSWVNFERLCKRLVERDQEIRDCRIYGRIGQKQKGIDLIAYPKDFTEKRPRVYQCKRVNDLSPDEIGKVVRKFLKEYKKVKPTHFVLCCHCLLDSTKQQDSILAQSLLLEKLGIVFEVWDGEKLSSILKDHPRIVDDFFSREWVKAFNGPEAADALERQFETSTEAFFPDIMRTGQFQASQIESLLVIKDVQIQDLRTALDEELSQACDKVKHLYRRGARTEAANEIRNYVNRFSTDFHGISKSVKAKFFCTAGEIIINTQPGLDEAKDYLQKIKQVAPSFDARILEARIKLAGKGKDRYDDALLILQPIDKTEIFNLNLGIFLEQDRLTEFQNLLLNPPVEADDVTAQLKSYYYRLQRDFKSAESAIQEAIGIASQYPSHHVAAGHICFWSAVPKNLDSPPHAILPQTFHPFSFVPSATGMSNLRRAFDHYEKALILVRSSYPQEVDYILELMGYQLLCLAYHTQEHEAARQLAEAILKEEPSNFIALFYCLEWGISFDMDKSIDSLETKRAQGQSDLNNLFALTRLYESKDEFDEAISLLKEERGKFYTEKEQYVWTSRILELVLSKGDETFAWQILNDYPSEDVTLKLRLEALFYDRMGNHPRLEEVGIKLCETTDTLLDLQNLCGFYRKTEQWGKLLPYSRRLLEICFDPSSCSLHIQALYYNRDYGECLKILDKAATLYLNDWLPDHLLRIKIECLRKLNRWNDAVHYMETLAHQKPSTDVFHNLVHAYVQLGKTEKAIAHLRLAGDASWADSELLMTGSQLLISTSPIEAFRFAEKAREKAMEDQRAWLNYIEAGFRTGHDGEALSALNAFQTRFPESLLLQRVELDSLFKQAKEWQEQRKKRWEMYRSAKVSAHMIADMERIPLGLDWFVRLKHNSSITLWDSKYPVWVQYGGKQKASLKDANAIIADYTALLIAFELKLLPYIEQAFGKIILPPSLLAVIQAESLRASEFQLSRLENCQLIKGMIDKGYISVLSDSFNEKALEAFQVKDLGVHDAALFYLAEENLGLVLAHHLYREDERRYQLNSGLREKRVFVHEILVALRKMGSISENDLNKALKPFADSQPPREAMLKLLEVKPLLITDATTIELFSELGMLEHLLQTFSMALPRFEAGSVLQALQNYQLRQHATEWLEDIRHYLSDRLDQKYCFPTVALKNGEGERHAGPCTRLLEEIVQIVQEQPLPVWVDDRFMLQYERIEQVPILGTVDILSILSDKGIISEQDRYGYLIKLMERNIQFLNPDPSMVFHYLKVTGHDTLGKLKESFELKTIRRYFNNILASGTALDPLPSMMGKPPEAILYFIKYQGTIRNILVSLWSDSNIAAEQKESDSTWIFHHLFRSFDEVAYLFPNALDDLGLTSLTQYYLLAIGFNILLEAKNKPLESATGYFQWLYTNYLADQWEVDPNIETATVDKLASFIIEMATKGKKEYRETFVKLSSILMAKIPKEITEALFNISRIEQLFHGYLEKTVTLPGGNRLLDYVWQS